MERQELPLKLRNLLASGMEGTNGERVSLVLEL